MGTCPCPDDDLYPPRPDSWCDSQRTKYQDPEMKFASMASVEMIE